MRSGKVLSVYVVMIREQRNFPKGSFFFSTGLKYNLHMRDRDHLEDKFRDAKVPYGDAYIIGSQFWLDSFTLHYDK